MGFNTVTGVANCRGYAKNAKLVNRIYPGYELVFHTRNPQILAGRDVLKLVQRVSAVYESNFS